MPRRAVYSAGHASAAGIAAADIGASSWGDVSAIKLWQARQAPDAAGDSLIPDGWFGPKSVRAYRRQQGAADADRIKVFGSWLTVPGVDQVEYRPDVLGGRARRVGQIVNSIVLHQSVTATRDRTERVLQRKGLGICSLIDGDGKLTVYGDIGMRYTAHGNERNRCSVGVEIVNPYYPKYLAPPWSEVAKSKTAHRGREIVDTDAQLRTAAAWLTFLTELECDGPGNRRIDIPRSFPTTSDAGPTRSHDAWFDLAVGGVFAHGHRPGRYPSGHRKAGKKTRAHADARRTSWLLKGVLGW